jgi:hypothetical protein
VLLTGTTDPGDSGLLSQKISELPLKIEGSPVERLVSRLYEELEAAGISFRPQTYLSDGWGCPDRVPVIGIPFYLADMKLLDLRYTLTGIAPENNQEAMMVLRHEAGHAFNYAYRLYDDHQWSDVFGRFDQPYRDDYKIVPFSTRFVRHVPGWYVQRHPDDDFAETFAVWLTPNSHWQEKYQDTPALLKLSYVDTVLRRIGRTPPQIITGELDMPLAKITMTVEAWFRSQKRRRRILLHPILNEDLKRLLPAKDGEPATEIFRANRQHLIRNIHMWTGLERRILTVLIDELLALIRQLGLKIEADETETRTMEFSVFVTTLAMNYVNNHRFIES